VFSQLNLVDGPAISAADTDVVVSHCSFDRIRSERTGDGAMGGAALFLDGCSADIQATSFNENMLTLQDSWAGADGMFAGHLDKSYSLRGGAIYADETSLQVTGCGFRANQVTAALLTPGPNGKAVHQQHQLLGAMSQTSVMNQCFAADFNAQIIASQPLGLRGGAIFATRSEVVVSRSDFGGNSAFTSTRTGLQPTSGADNSLFSSVSSDANELWHTASGMIASRTLSWDAALTAALASTTAADWEGGAIYATYTKLQVHNSTFETAGGETEFATVNGAAIVADHVPVLENDNSWGIWCVPRFFQVHSHLITHSGAASQGFVVCTIR
jgi:hypothetical protein